MNTNPLKTAIRMVEDMEHEAVNSNENKILVDLDYDIRPLLTCLQQALELTDKVDNNNH